MYTTKYNINKFEVNDNRKSITVSTLDSIKEHHV